jgi:hypothetical protein
MALKTPQNASKSLKFPPFFSPSDQFALHAFPVSLPQPGVAVAVAVGTWVAFLYVFLYAIHG